MSRRYRQIGVQMTLGLLRFKIVNLLLGLLLMSLVPPVLILLLHLRGH